MIKKIVFIIGLISSLNADMISIFNDIGKALTEKENKNVKKVDNWLNTKLIEIENQFNNKYLLAVEGKIEEIDDSKFENVKKMLPDLKSYDYQKSSMKDNSEYCDSLQMTIEDFILTQKIINSIFDKYNSELLKDIQSYPIYEYQEANNIKDIPYDKFASYQLKKMFYSKYPKYENYLPILKNFEENLKSFQNEIIEYSYNFEEKLFLNKINKLDNNINQIEEEELAKIIYDEGFEPKKDILYKMGKMRILQALNNGFLVQSEYGSAIKSTIFIESSKKFVDNKILNDSAYYLIFKGNVKYQSLIGIKTVYAFKLFDIKKDYYFFD